MAQGKDFYGQEVTIIIEEACRELGVSQEELDIEVLETGSAGIFGLCKKKAHIRVRKKKADSDTEEKKKKSISSAVSRTKKTSGRRVAGERAAEKKKQETTPVSSESEVAAEEQQTEKNKKISGPKKATHPPRAGNKKISAPVTPPTDDVLVQVKTDICRLVELMGYPSEVTLKVEDTALRCHISGEHEDEIVGSEGRTLDSMQYLLRKMMSSSLPDRMMLSLDAGDFRQRRAEELKIRALQLAEEVKETGKTQAIPALNPAERREVHMILQEDKSIRSRSVGDGLFKKILIYKPGKSNKSSSRKRRGRQSGRSTEN